MVTIKTKTIKEYFMFLLKPEHKIYSYDSCEVVFKEDHLLLNVSIDNTGNSFKLSYKALKGVIKDDTKKV